MTVSLIPMPDVHEDAFEVVGLPTVNMKQDRDSAIQTFRNAAKRTRGAKVITRSRKVFVAKNAAAAQAIGEAFPITGRGKKPSVDLGEMIAQAKAQD